MKKATLIAIVVTLSSVMFANVNITWGNSYSDDGAGDMETLSSFGVWFDVNDRTSVGWENGLKVSLDGPGSSSFRLGYDGGTSLGANWNWLDGGAGGWNTTLGTAVDFQLTNVAGAGQGDFTVTINLGLGF